MLIAEIAVVIVVVLLTLIIRKEIILLNAFVINGNQINMIHKKIPFLWLC